MSKLTKREDVLAKLYVMRPLCLEHVAEHVIVELEHMCTILGLDFSKSEIERTTKALESGVYGYEEPPFKK